MVREVLDDFALVGWPKTSGSRGMHVYVRIERRWDFQQVRRAALALAREVERRAPSLATSKWWKEERQGVFIDYNQNAKDRTIAAAYSVRPRPDARVSAPLGWDEIESANPADFTLTTMPRRFAEQGDPHAAMDQHPCSLERVLELSAKQERDGLGDAPWPPHYRKQPGEPDRVQPSRRSLKAGSDRSAEASRSTRPAEASRSDASIQPSRSAGRRVPKHPLIEIARAERKDDALAGLERWKARHPDAAGHLEPADILVDAMRGRFHTWTRIRINLRHVPEALRPPQEPLDPDDAPHDWDGVNADAWKHRRRARARRES
jgi:hypothetical protein